MVRVVRTRPAAKGCKARATDRPDTRSHLRGKAFFRAAPATRAKARASQSLRRTIDHRPSHGHCGEPVRRISRATFLN
jgi:hypothetical protein